MDLQSRAASRTIWYDGAQAAQQRRPPFAKSWIQPQAKLFSLRCALCSFTLPPLFVLRIHESGENSLAADRDGQSRQMGDRAPQNIFNAKLGLQTVSDHYLAYITDGTLGTLFIMAYYGVKMVCTYFPVFHCK